MRHPARTYDYDTLEAMMMQAVADGLVNMQTGDDGLRLFCYTRAAVYDRKWTPATLMARGLILDVQAREVVATPFPKFFNVGELDQFIPDMPFETFSKIDGSLIIIFHHGGQWKTATKGSFRSEQAQWAKRQLDHADLDVLYPGATYLAEAVYKANRIVIHYDNEGLILLGGYLPDGTEMEHLNIRWLSALIGWPHATSHQYMQVSELLALAPHLPATEEGFVLRFADGLRLKIKGDEYKRIHALISRVTPLAMWEAMMAGDDLDLIRRELPEEFWADFDAIVSNLKASVDFIVTKTKLHADSVAHWDDKKVGLNLLDFPEAIRRFIFPYRNNGGDLLSGRTRAMLFRSIRPTGNQLAGYTPSYAMNRVLEDAA